MQNTNFCIIRVHTVQYLRMFELSTENHPSDNVANRRAPDSRSVRVKVKLPRLPTALSSRCTSGEFQKLEMSDQRIETGTSELLSDENVFSNVSSIENLQSLPNDTKFPEESLKESGKDLHSCYNK